MAGDVYRRFCAAAVQAAPVFLNREATIARLADWVAKAKGAGADLVVFGESYIPAFPLWNLLYAPIDQHAFYRRLFDNAVEVPGPQVDQLAEIARRHRVILSVETDPRHRRFLQSFRYIPVDGRSAAQPPNRIHSR